jgi:integrase
MSTSAADRRSPLGLFPGQLAPRLYDRVVEVLRTRHYSRRTEEAYLHWTRPFLLGHKDVQTTMVYTHVLNRGGRGVHSPLDRMQQVLPVESWRIIRTDRSA